MNVIITVLALTLVLSGMAKQDTIIANNHLRSAARNELAGRMDSAIYHTRQALDIFKQLKNPYKYFGTLTALGRNYISTGNYDQGIITCQRVIQESAEQDYHKYIPEAYLNMAVAINAQGKYKMAIDSLEKAYDLALGYKTDSVVIGRILGNIGTNYEPQGKYEEAIKYYLQSENIYRSLASDHPNLGAIYVNIGNVYQRLAQLSKAREYFELGLPLLRNRVGNEHPYIAMTYANIALTYKNSSDFGKALEYYREAERIFIKAWGPSNPNNYMLYTNLAAVYTLIGRNDEALEYLNRSLTIVLNSFGPQHPSLATIYLNMGRLYQKLAQYKKAEEYLSMALEKYIATFGTDHHEVAGTRNTLAEIKMKLNKSDEAGELVQANLQLPEQVLPNAHPNRSAVYRVASRYYMEVDSTEKALDMLLAGINEYAGENAVDNDVPEYKHLSGHYFELVELLNLAGQVFSDKKDESNLIKSVKCYDIALNLVRDNLNVLKTRFSREHLVEQYYGYIDNAIGACYELSNLTGNDEYKLKALQFAEYGKGVILAMSVNDQSAKSFAGIPDSLTIRENALKTEVAYLEAERNKLIIAANTDSAQIDKTSKQLFQRKKELDNLLARFDRDYPEYYELKYRQFSNGPVSVNSLSVSPEEAILEYFYGDEDLYLFSIADGKIQFSLIESKSIDEQIDKLNTWLRNYRVGESSDRSVEEYAEIAARLYEMLIPDEVADLISNKKQLTIIPDGKLSYIPFEALVTSATMESSSFRTLPYLLKQHHLAYANSLMLLQLDPVKNNDVSKGYVGFAPEYSETLLAQSDQLSQFGQFRSNPAALTGNKTEVELSGGLFKGNTYFGEQASERMFKENAKNSKVLHLAMHALTDDENPLYSKFIFTQTNDSLEDDYLNVYELYNLQLNADLAVLSACETGYGKLIRGEGVASLGRAFAYAGCPSVVMSYWKADDHATSELMVEFFKELKKGSSKSEALRNAKLNYLDKADNMTSHPFFWANFVVVGNNEPVDISSGNQYWFWVLGIILSAGTVFYFISNKKDKKVL